MRAAPPGAAIDGTFDLSPCHRKDPGSAGRSTARVLGLVGARFGMTLEHRVVTAPFNRQSDDGSSPRGWPVENVKAGNRLAIDAGAGCIQGNSRMSVTEFEILGEVAVAMLFGGMIGAERELAHKPAGFRTHMLVAGAAAMLVGLAATLMGRFATLDANVTGDPIRVVQAVVLGISFLGAGTIVQRRGGSEVDGLTTGAALLFSGAVGVAVALRQWWLASCCTLLVLVVLRIVGRLERRL